MEREAHRQEGGSAPLGLRALTHISVPVFLKVCFPCKREKLLDSKEVVRKDPRFRTTGLGNPRFSDNISLAN